MHEQYSLLGLENGADKEAIKIAFRRLAMVYHPDRAMPGCQKFNDICKAYQELMNQPSGYQTASVHSYPLKNHMKNSPAVSFNKNRRFGKRGSPGDRRFETVSESEYKGTQVRLSV